MTIASLAKPIYTHIHDTLTSGLQLDVESASYENLKNTLMELDGKPGGTRFNSKGKFRFKWKVLGDPKLARKGKVSDEQWKVLLYNKQGENFTTMGIKLRQERGKYYLNLTANPTAVRLGEYAVRKANGEPSSVLLSPFYAIEDLNKEQDIFSQGDWEKIEQGDIALHNIEICFKFIVGAPKKDVLKVFNAIYGSNLNLDGDVHHLCDHLGLRFSRYPEHVIRPGEMTGVTIQASDNYSHQKFKFTLYDKEAEMVQRGKMKTGDGRLDPWRKYLRMDIRIYPTMMRKLIGGGKKSYTLADWIAFEKRNPDMTRFLTDRMNEELGMSFFLKTRDEINEFRRALKKRFGRETASAWENSISYNASELCARLGLHAGHFSEFLAEHGIVSGHGGLAHAMQHVFNLTSGLNLHDLLEIGNVRDLARMIEQKKQTTDYDAWEELKGKVRTALEQAQARH